MAEKNIQDTDAVTRASLPRFYIIFLSSQLSWAGHVVRMKDHRLRKKMLYRERLQD